MSRAFNTASPVTTTASDLELVAYRLRSEGLVPLRAGSNWSSQDLFIFNIDDRDSARNGSCFAMIVVSKGAETIADSLAGGDARKAVHSLAFEGWTRSEQMQCLSKEESNKMGKLGSTHHCFSKLPSQQSER